MRGKTSSRFLAGVSSAMFFLAGLGLAGAQTDILLTADELIGSSIRTGPGEVAGEIRALVLDAERGSIRFVVVEIPGGARRTVAVPWSYLDVRRDGSVRLRASEDDLLRAPSYPAGRALPEVEVSEPTTFAPNDDDDATFDPARVVSYRGVVVGTMTAPLERGVDVVVAVVDVGEEEIQAHLGPRSYLERIALDIEPGQSVVLEGTPSEEDGRTVVAVSRVLIGDRSFELRSTAGAPRWRSPE